MTLDWRLISGVALQSLDVEELIGGVERHVCQSYGEKVSQLLQVEGRWSPEQLECLRFVGAVLTMGLRPDQPAEPFGPLFVFNGERSCIPSDFPKKNLLELQPWALALRNPELRARFLDVLWVQARSFPAAQGAIEAYIASARVLEHPDDWTSCHKRLERALRLAAGLGKGGADLRTRVLQEVEAVLHRYRGTDPLYLTLRLARLMLEFRLGDFSKFAEYAATAANSADAAKDYWRAKEYFQLAAECFSACSDTDGETTALRSSAESLVKEAELAYGQSGRGAIVAASVLSDAVEMMRQVPGGQNRALELHKRLLHLQKESTAQLKAFSTKTDGTDLVQRALAVVRGKPLHDAVFSLCTIAKPPSLERLKEAVREQARVAVLGSLFSNDVLNSRGRVVARAPGLDANADDVKDEGLRWRMFQQARTGRHLTVQAVLNPVRAEILETHSPDRQDIFGLVRNSPWIPPGHAESVVRALLAGFQGDMLVAAHLIPPQLEAVVRHVVESHGGVTSKLEPGGVQPERSLGILLETPEALTVFGEDGVFEMQDLLTEQLGTNLRNEVAHGLLGDSQLFGTDVLYVWWLLLRYCVLTSKLVERQEQELKS